MVAPEAPAWEEEAVASGLPPPAVPPGPSPRRPDPQHKWRLGLPRWRRDGRPHSTEAQRRPSPPRTPRSSNLRGTLNREADRFAIDSQESERADVEDIARVVNEHIDHATGWLEKRQRICSTYSQELE